MFKKWASPPFVAPAAAHGGRDPRTAAQRPRRHRAGRPLRPALSARRQRRRQYDTFVGRIREDLSHPSALDMWIVADNLLKGAASNAVQIAEIL
jgi:aspartate-semialdehyde dehydrogenase